MVYKIEFVRSHLISNVKDWYQYQVTSIELVFTAPQFQISHKIVDDIFGSKSVVSVDSIVSPYLIDPQPYLTCHCGITAPCTISTKDTRPISLTDRLCSRYCTVRTC